MDIDKNNIKFTFYFDGNKYIVFSLTEEISFGSDLYFAKEIKDTGEYESINDLEYEKVLNEYKGYLNSVEDGVTYED